MIVVSIFKKNKGLQHDKQVMDNLKRTIHEDCLNAAKTGLFQHYQPEYRNLYITILQNYYNRLAVPNWKWGEAQYSIPEEYRKELLWGMLLLNFGIHMVISYHKSHLVEFGWLETEPEEIKWGTSKPPLYFITKGQQYYLD